MNSRVERSRLADLGYVYAALLRAALVKALEYRAQAVLWMVSAIFPLVMMVVWLAVAREAGARLGWSSDDFISYYVGAAMIQRFTTSFSVWRWQHDIQQGDLSAKLLRPCDPAHYYVAEQLGWKLFDLLTIVPIVIVVAWLLPAVQFPLTVSRLGALILVIVLAFAINELLSAIFGVLAFWTPQSTAVYSLLIGIGQFLSGWIAPLALFPASIRVVAAWLPFYLSIDLPVSILTGRAAWPQIWLGLAVALGWLLVFFALFRLLYRLGLRRYEAVGA